MIKVTPLPQKSILRINFGEEDPEIPFFGGQD